MKIEELARNLAKRYGEQLEMGTIDNELRWAGLPDGIPTRERLINMVENIHEEAYRLWDEKHPLEDPPPISPDSGRPEMLSDRLGYPSSVGDAEWARKQARGL